MPSTFESAPASRSQGEREIKSDQELLKTITSYFSRLNLCFDQYIEEESDEKEKQNLKSDKVRLDRIDRQLRLLGLNPEGKREPKDIADALYGMAYLNLRDRSNVDDPNIAESHREGFRNDYQESRKIFTKAIERVYPNINTLDIARTLYQ